MSNKQRYQYLMEGIRQSHLEFAAIWKEVRASELQKRNIVETERIPADSEDEGNPDDIELDEAVDFHYPAEEE